MSGEYWWWRLRPATRDWLVANNGDAVPDEVGAEVVSVGGPLAERQSAHDGDGPGLFYPDAIIDRIEELANGEAPGDFP